MVSLMNVSILVCGCGLKVRAQGELPAAWGDAPGAAASCAVPDSCRRTSRCEPAPSIPPGRQRAMVSNQPRTIPLARRRGRRHPSDITPSRVRFRRAKKCVVDGGRDLAAARRQTETSWFASILYPLRSADSLAVIASLTAILWLFTILVPEYCLGLMGDADDMGKCPPSAS